MTFSGEVHPLATKAPMLDEQSLRELAESIRTVGQLNPIVIDAEGVLLDGRNRLAACALVGVDPIFVVHDGDPVEVILAAEDRRHQTPGQRAMWRAAVMAEAGLRSGGRWKRGSVDNPESGISKAGQNALTQAGLILDHRPDLAEKVIDGEVALDDAYQKAREAKREAEQVDELDSDLAALVRSGTLKIGEALSRQALPEDLRERVNAGHIATDEAKQLLRERDDRVRFTLDAIKRWRDACEQLDADRHSPEYPLALGLLDPDTAKAVRKEFPHAK